MKRLLSTFAVLALAGTSATTSTAWIKNNQQFNATDPKTAQNETAQDIANKLEGKTINLQFKNWVSQKISDNLYLLQNALVNQGLLTQDEAKYIIGTNVSWRVKKQVKAPGCTFSFFKDGQTATAGDITLNIYTGYKIWDFNNVLYANDPNKEQLITSTDGGTTWKTALGGGQVAWMKMVHGIIFLQFTFSKTTYYSEQSVLYFIRPNTSLKIYNIGINDSAKRGFVKGINFMVTYSDYNSSYYVYIDFPFFSSHIISATNPNALWSVDFNGSGARGGTENDNYVNQMVATKNMNPASAKSDLLYFKSAPHTTKSGSYTGGYVNAYNIATNYWYSLLGGDMVKNLSFLNNNIFEETSRDGLWQLQGSATAFSHQLGDNNTAVNQIVEFNKGYYVATTNGLYYWYPGLAAWNELKTFYGEHYTVSGMQIINNTLYAYIPEIGLLKSYVTPKGKIGFNPVLSFSKPGLIINSVQNKLGVIYVFTNQGVYQSFDNGTSFQLNQDLANVSSTTINYNKSVVIGNNVFIIANGYEYESTDGGFTFKTTKL